MLVARLFDARDGDGPYVSSARPRLADPETRGRVAGYLCAAPAVSEGWRTDGRWAWRVELAERVSDAGVGPERELLDHIEAQRYLAPTVLTDEIRTEALACLREHDPDPPVRAGDRAAATAADRRCARWHEQLLVSASESTALSAGPRVARVFDGEAPAGTPWFSPRRLRIVEPERRRRLVDYLSRARLVMRATGHMADPLEPGKGRVVPLSHRTDGVWVWPDALAYYLRERGVAPELELLCHIERAGARLPETVSDGTVAAAVAAAKRGPGSRPTRTPVAYYLDQRSGQILVGAPDGDPMRAQVLVGLRWRPSDDLLRDARGGSDRFREIDEAAAIQFVDERWAHLSAV